MMNYTFALIGWLTVAIGMQVLVLIQGWGLEPQSWWWIIGVGIFMQSVWRTVGTKIQPPSKRNSTTTGEPTK